MVTNHNMSDDEFDFNKKKKSVKRKTIIEATAMVPDETINDAPTEEGNYTYEFLVTRAFNALQDSHPGPGRGPKKLSPLPPPELARIGTKRTGFLNFSLICKILNRQEKNLFEYIIAELGTKASIDANHVLIIRGRYRQTQIEQVLCSFIREYVFCKTCTSSDTLLAKAERLLMLKCNDCHSHYSVSRIKTGFQAQVDRRSRAT